MNTNFYEMMTEKAKENNVDISHFKVIDSSNWIDVIEYIKDEVHRNKENERIKRLNEIEKNKVENRIKRAYEENKAYYDSIEYTYSMDRIMESYNESKYGYY